MDSGKTPSVTRLPKEMYHETPLPGRRGTAAIRLVPVPTLRDEGYELSNGPCGDEEQKSQDERQDREREPRLHNHQERDPPHTKAAKPAMNSERSFLTASSTSRPSASKTLPAPAT